MIRLKTSIYKGFTVTGIRQAFYPGPRGWINVHKRRGESLDLQMARVLDSGATSVGLILHDSSGWNRCLPDFKAEEVVVERICAGCRKGWEGTGDVPHQDQNGFEPALAEVYVVGKKPDKHGYMRPFKAFLCQEHAQAWSDFEDAEYTEEVAVRAYFCESTPSV